MIKLHTERYELFFDSIHQDHEGIMIDVIAESNKKDPIFKGKIGLLFCSEDKGEGKEHEVWGFYEFKDTENLRLAQIGIELLQEAMGREDETENINKNS